MRCGYNLGTTFGGDLMTNSRNAYRSCGKIFNMLAPTRDLVYLQWKSLSV